MIARWVVSAAGLLGLAAVACSGSNPVGTDETAGMREGAIVLITAPGRIEGGSDLVEVGAGMDGVIDRVLVAEGDRVEQGRPLVRLVCDDLEARLKATRAEVESLQQTRVRLLRGSRQEERDAAEAVTSAARAALTEAEARHERLRRLAEEEAIIAPQELDEARRDRDVALAGLARAVEQERFVNAAPLAEEVARADSDIAAARSRAREAEARVVRCTIAAPSAATVLRVHLREGEQVSLALPRPIVSLADVSRWRVRAEVDERDVGKVRQGQPVRVEWDALEGPPLTGRVTLIEPLMGRKRIRTGDPAEKSDRDVQEVVVDLDPVEAPLVVGLRVTVYVLEEAASVR